MKPEYFDIHSHLNFESFDEDREEVIDEMSKQKIWTVTVGTDLKTSKEAVALAEKHPHIFASIGLHPEDNAAETFDEAAFSELVAHPKVVTIGECGLDYFKKGMEGQQGAARSVSTGSIRVPHPASPETLEKKRQKDEFEKQIEFAVKHDKPLMIHCREAYPDALEMLRSKKNEYGDRLRGNFHFFMSGVEVAKQCLEIGFTVSFPGPITFVSSMADTVRYVPLDRMMAETDSPFAAPVPFRGKRNNPLYVKEIVKKIAEIKNEPLEKVQSALVDNALHFFHINFSNSLTNL